VVLAAKFAEIVDELPTLFGAIADLRSMRLVIKPHPAETEAVYRPLSASVANVTVAPVTSDLARLLAVADAVITMNSTVAIDALSLGIPSLVVGLPNNLTPFVEAGVMLGATRTSLPEALETLLYDRQARGDLLERAAAFVDRHGMQPDGGAAVRAADEIAALIE
jgi:CDP-glycerol glycerophosphotransferase (TagB/SpsB family)